MTARSTPSQLFIMFSLTGLLTTVLWLESLDRYLNARMHMTLEPLLPAEIYSPSRTLNGWLHHFRPVENTAVNIPVQEYQAPKTPIKLSPAISESHPPASESHLATPGIPVVKVQPHPALPPVRTDLQPGEFLQTLSQQHLTPGVQRILFAGDSMMQGVAPLVIRQLHKEHTDWEMYDLSRINTGLAVKRYFDWPKHITEEMDAKNLTLVIIFLGPNDPWDIYLPDKRIPFPSAQWEEHYAGQVDKILAEAAARQVRVIWVGLPSMREARWQSGAIIQNRIFFGRAQQWQTNYLATEPLIGVLSDPYQKFLINAEGKSVNLRAEDGIHFAPSGLNIIKQALVDHIDHALQP